MPLFFGVLLIGVLIFGALLQYLYCDRARNLVHLHYDIGSFSTRLSLPSLPLPPVLSTDLLAYYRHLGQSIFTVVDVETTGYRPPTSRVIEVSVLQANLAQGILHQQTHLLNPEVPVPPAITRLTGITQAMVNAAPRSSEIWRSYLPWLNTGILTAHNLAFDYRFLQAEFNFVDVAFYRPEADRLCTVLLSRLLLPELPSRSLPNLVQHFGFNVGRSHRAEADTLACWLLTEHLLSDLTQRSDESLLNLFRQQWISLKAAATMLQVSRHQAQKQLQTAGVFPRLGGRYRTPLYQRQAVEAVYWANLYPEEDNRPAGEEAADNRCNS